MTYKCVVGVYVLNNWGNYEELDICILPREAAIELKNNINNLCLDEIYDREIKDFIKTLVPGDHIDRVMFAYYQEIPDLDTAPQVVKEENNGNVSSARKVYVGA